MLSLRLESWFPHAQLPLCWKGVRQCNDLTRASLSVSVASPRGFVALLWMSQTLQTPEMRHYIPVVLFTRYFFSPPSFLLPSIPVLPPNHRGLKTSLSSALLNDSASSFSSLLCTHKCKWLSIQFSLI